MKNFTGLNDYQGYPIIYGDYLWGVNTVNLLVVKKDNQPYITFSSIWGHNQIIKLTNKEIVSGKLSIKKIGSRARN